MISAAGLRVEGRLWDVALELPAGCLAAVLGPNGAGKSTLLQALAGLLPAEGDVRWRGEALAHIPFLDRARLLAWVGQESHADFGFPVREVVAQGRFAHGGEGGGVEEALQAFDLVHIADRPVTRLSGGERRRVFLARALATGAPIQLWDEPTSHLDVRHGLEVLELANGLRAKGATVLMSLHDLRAARCFDRVLVLHRGACVAQGAPDDVLTPEVLLEVFGVKARLAQDLILELPR
jgi:iron complex transport system ATP-binding protein